MVQGQTICSKLFFKYIFNERTLFIKDCTLASTAQYNFPKTIMLCLVMLCFFYNNTTKSKVIWRASFWIERYKLNSTYSLTYNCRSSKHLCKRETLQIFNRLCIIPMWVVCKWTMFTMFFEPLLLLANTVEIWVKFPFNYMKHAVFRPQFFLPRRTW